MHTLLYLMLIMWLPAMFQILKLVKAGKQPACDQLRADNFEINWSVRSHGRVLCNSPCLVQFKGSSQNYTTLMPLWWH